MLEELRATDSGCTNLTVAELNAITKNTVCTTYYLTNLQSCLRQAASVSRNFGRI